MGSRVACTSVVLCLAILMSASFAPAQEVLETSTWSLELGTDLGDEGVMLGLRRHLGERTAIRLAVAGTWDDFEGDGSSLNPPAAPIPVERAGGFNSYEAAIQWIHYASVADRVAAQFGIGPTIEGFRSYNRNTSSAGLPGFSENEFHNSQTLYGVVVSLGLEWFFTRRFSLGGRSGIEALTGTRNETNIFRNASGNDETHTEVDEKRLQVRGAEILLTGYF